MERVACSPHLFAHAFSLMRVCGAHTLTPNLFTHAFFLCFTRCVCSHICMPPQITDIVLYFCIWGEGANLRHTPECLCFLYHKMHESYERSDAYARQTRSLYPGHFLDAVVSPIFDVYKESLTNGKDHINKKNYDDFNEFFWGSKCLQYMYRTAGSDAESTLEAGLASR